MQRSLILFLLAFFCSAASANENTPLWLRYPAVSPDGSTIVFSSGGQLYRVPAEGGEAIALTGGDSYAFQPQWSPDGKWIAFAADRYGNLDVFIMPSAGGAARRLTTHSVGDYPTGFSADGKSVLFTSRRLGDPTADFYAADLGMHWQLYSVPVEGGREVMVLPTPALEAVEAPTGGLYLYENNPSGEQPWRKHERSAGTRDIWLYDAASGTHRAVTSFAGHDREPVWTPDGRNFYALSEESGSLNIWSYALFDKRASFQVTFHDKHPVRSPSISTGGDLVYGYDGEIWRLKAGGNAPERVSIILPRDSLESGPRYETAWYGATEVALSPGGEELAIVLRGEIFVLALDGSATRRITTTAGIERGVSFTSDGRCLVYAAERETWGLYQTCLNDEFEFAFFDATLMEESLLLDSEAEEFQPLLSPDGSSIAYLSDRDEIRLLDLQSGETRTLLPAADNYSYADGDIWYAWSPDGQWLAASYAPNAYNPDVALIDVLNGGEPVNITPNGYLDIGGVWAPDGLTLFWLTDLLGLRRSDSNPGEVDIFAAALTRAAEDRMELSPEAFAREPAADPDAPAEELELNGVERRIFRITPNSSDIIGYDLTADGETVVYVTYDWDADYPSAAVWRLEWRSGTLYQIASDLYLDQTAMTFDRANDLLYLIGSDGIYEVDAEGGVFTIYYDAELALDTAAERQAIFDHVWRLTREKFYKPDLHGVDWDFYRDAYRRFLPHIDNSRDFAEMLSEMVGELNASHTGAFYYGGRSDGDATATLGLYFESNFAGPGVKVARVLEGGPADRADSLIEPGVIILAIDGKPIEADDNLHDFLNRKTGVKVRLTLQGAEGSESWDEILTPIGYYEEADLAYWDWINQNRERVKELSGGRIGYIHLSAMDEGNYQRAFANIFGRYGDAEALIVDIRFNAGGNLTNQLLTLLTGKQYVTWQPRDRPVGIEPFDRWTKPSIVLMNAAAYSDGSFFPFSYRELGVGKLLGEAVPGTGTAVWWEDQQNPDLVYGIPQAGYGDLEGEYLENQQVEPDIAVALTPEAIAQGRDTQLEAAVEELLKQLP